MFLIKYIILLVLVAFQPTYAIETNTLQFDLSNEKVRSAWISELDNGEFTVALELEEPYKSQFSHMTENNIGKRLQIVVLRNIMTDAEIRTRIPSGIIGIGKSHSKVEAIRLLELVLLASDEGEMEKRFTHNKTDCKQCTPIGGSILNSVIRTMESVPYEINGSIVQNLKIDKSLSGQCIVTIDLKEPYRRELSILKVQNIGKKMQIVYAGQVLSVNIIDNTINPWDLVVGEWDAVECGVKFAKNLLLGGSVQD